jgi:hypothetical protein
MKKKVDQLAVPSERHFPGMVFLASFAFYCLIMWCAPYSSDDLEFATLPYHTFGEYLQYVLEYGNGRFLGNFCAIWLTNSPVMCVLVKALVMALTIVLLPQVLGMTGAGAYLLSFLMVTAIEPAVFGEVYAWTSGFSNYMPPVFLSLLLLWLIQRVPGLSKIWQKIAVGLCVAVLGVAAQLFIEHSSCINVLLALGAVAVYTKRREKSAAWISAVWLMAAVLGLGMMLVVPKIFHIADNHTDVYRSVHLNSVVSIVVSCAKNVVQLTNHYFGPCTLPLCFGAFTTVYLTRSRRSEKANKCLCLLSAGSLIYLLLSLALNLDIYLGKSAIVQHVLSGAAAVIPFAVWVVAAFGVEDKVLRCKLLALLALAFVSLGMLLVVTPIPTRVIFQAHVFVMLGALLCFDELRKEIPENWSRVAGKTAVALSLTLAVLLGSVFVSIRFMAQAREEHILRELENGADEIAIFSLPYTYTTWDHLWGQKFYNNTGRDVNFSIMEFDTWMSDIYR